MQLMHKKDLLKLGHEVVFHDYNGAHPSDMSIYCFACGEHDFIYQPLIASFLSAGSNHDMDLIYQAKEDDKFDIAQDYECQSREGLFEDDSRYYVLSKDDLGKLIQRLTRTYDQMPDEAKEECKNG